MCSREQLVAYQIEIILENYKAAKNLFSHPLLSRSRKSIKSSQLDLETPQYTLCDIDIIARFK